MSNRIVRQKAYQLAKRMSQEFTPLQQETYDRIPDYAGTFGERVHAAYRTPTTTEDARFMASRLREEITYILRNYEAILLPGNTPTREKNFKHAANEAHDNAIKEVAGLITWVKHEPERQAEAVAEAVTEATEALSYEVRYLKNQIKFLEQENALLQPHDED